MDIIIVSREDALRNERAHARSKYPTWETLVYFVAAPREDGTAPSIEKAIGEKLHLTFDEADKARNQFIAGSGNPYAVFMATITIPRKAPVLAEYKDLFTLYRDQDGVMYLENEWHQWVDLPAQEVARLTPDRVIQLPGRYIACHRSTCCQGQWQCLGARH